MKRAAHTLKGASLSVGAIQTSDLAQLLEDTPSEDNLTEAEKIFDELQSSMEQVVAAANDYLASHA